MLEKDGMFFPGGKRVELLEAIDLRGSISQAAKALVTRLTGGRHGGGARLTEHGRQIIRLFRAGEREYQKIMDALTDGMENFIERQAKSPITLRQFGCQVVNLLNKKNCLCFAMVAKAT